jgi:hypothetical protein
MSLINIAIRCCKFSKRELEYLHCNANIDELDVAFIDLQ